MVRLILGIVIGAVVWLVAVFVFGRLVSFSWKEFADIAATRDNLLFTVPMLAARLGISAASSIVSGYVAALIARDSFKGSLGAGVLLLIVFVPYHLTIWNEFPIWYHLAFFASLPLLSLVGGRLAR